MGAGLGIGDSIERSPSRWVESVAHRDGSPAVTNSAEDRSLTESRIPNPESRIPNPESRPHPMPSILLVEDETAIADTVLYALRAEGFAARHCLTGQEALRAAEEDIHDLAILDVGLPDIGGFALCRGLRRDRDLPVIFLTARDAEAGRVLGLELGADDYVVKPFSP